MNRCTGHCNIIVLKLYLNIILSINANYCFILSTDCKFNCHKKCAPQVPKDCTGDLPVGDGKLQIVHS